MKKQIYAWCQCKDTTVYHLFEMKISSDDCYFSKPNSVCGEMSTKQIISYISTGATLDIIIGATKDLNKPICEKCLKLIEQRKDN
jgi:hypothetical protein